LVHLDTRDFPRLLNAERDRDRHLLRSPVTFGLIRTLISVLLEDRRSMTVIRCAPDDSSHGDVDPDGIGIRAEIPYEARLQSRKAYSVSLRRSRIER